MVFCLAFMLLERSAQLTGMRGLGHFRQRLEDVLLGEIHVLEGIKEQVVEVFVFCCGHGVLTLVDGDRMLPASQREVMRFVPTA